MRRFTLNRMKDFGNAEHATILGFGSLIVDLPGISANHAHSETSNSRVIERKRKLSARLNCDSIAAKIAEES